MIVATLHLYIQGIIEAWCDILFIFAMQGKKEDIEIDESITYSLVSDTFSKSLKLHNKSPHIYVFKVKTNQRSVISMQLTHDFIKPGTTKEIVIKLAEKPSETTPLRLEFNYAIPTEEEIRINDSKMNSYGKDAVFRKIVTITRDDSVNPATGAVVGPGDRSKEGMGMATETVNISNMSFSEEKTEEVRPVFSERKEEIKVEVKVEPKVQPKPAPKVEPRIEQKVEPKAEPKPEPKPVEQKSSIFPSLSSYLPRQVESEQITVQTSKSTSINIAELNQQPPKAINKPVNLANLAQQALKNQQPVLSESNNVDNFSYASSSPTNKRIVLQKRGSSSQQSQKSLQELTQKLQRQKSTVLRLKTQQSISIRSDCVYPVPVIYLLVLGAFLSGSLMNWLIL